MSHIPHQIPFDALNCGNHELYDNATMERFGSSGYIASWKGRYLTTNLLNATTNAPLGATSAVLTGAVSGVRLLSFGFMYNMQAAEGARASTPFWHQHNDRNSLTRSPLFTSLFLATFFLARTLHESQPCATQRP